MKIYLTILTSFFCIIVQSQSYKVVDNATNLPVQYATLQTYDGGKFIAGFYSDDNGSINIISDLNFSEIKVSCIGYETIIVQKNQYTIKLNQNTTVLKEVIVTNKDYLNIDVNIIQFHILCLIIEHFKH